MSISIISVFILFLFKGNLKEYKMKNSGYYQNGKVGKAHDFQKRRREETNEKKEIKKRERKIVTDTDYDAMENKQYSWWFKRNKEHKKSGCQEDFDLSTFDAFYVAPGEERCIYLTFDCGYENHFTNSMLDILDEEKVKAAFFVTQTYIRDNLEIVKRMKKEGHLVCNHTVKHPSMPTICSEDQKKELLDCENYMKEMTGYEMDLFFRPPKGEYSKRTLQIAKDLGYTTIFWSMAYLDYDIKNQPSSEYVVEHFRKYHHTGAIPLLHNVSLANKDALRQIIVDLKKEGYQFRTLYDLNKNINDLNKMKY